MTASPPHSHHSGRDLWLSDQRIEHVLGNVNAHTASISSMTAPAPPYNLRRWVWLGIFLGVLLFWGAIGLALWRLFT
jgi:hypothetical protein